MKIALTVLALICLCGCEKEQIETADKFCLTDEQITNLTISDSTPSHFVSFDNLPNCWIDYDEETEKLIVVGDIEKMIVELKVHRMYNPSTVFIIDKLRQEQKGGLDADKR